ncbi:uncharacterized protein [Musca autumnalis]|uniref:uncharacterized protein n=1 Tax=Musca autumnalis TaxID=221902 RepID=UPI003CF8EA18
MPIQIPTFTGSSEPFPAHRTTSGVIIINADMKPFWHTSLPSNLTPVEFNNAWRASSKYRTKLFLDGTSNITDILKMWPQYKRSNGYQLIDIDFNVLNKHG